MLIMTRDLNESKVCSVCKQSKSIKEYCNHPLAKDGKQSRCKECDALISKAKYQTRKQLIEGNRVNG